MTKDTIKILVSYGNTKGGADMSEENYICRKCGFEFIAIPGAEEPPDCPECASDQTEKLELATVGKTTEQKGGK